MIFSPKTQATTTPCVRDIGHDGQVGHDSGAPIRALCVSIVSVALLFFMQQLLLGSHYETNDDSVHAIMLCGAWPGSSPEEHLLTPNIVFSLAIKSLYQLAPHVPWYFTFLLGLQFAGSTTLQFLMIKRFDTKYGICAYWTFFLFVQCYLLATLQFTSTALFTAGAASLLIIDSAVTGSLSVAALAAALSLIAGSALLRYHSCMLAMALSLPLAVLSRMENRKKLYCAGFLIAACGLIQLTQTITTNSFHTSGPWGEFYSVRAPLMKLIDFAGVDDASKSPVLKAARWSANDARMLRNFLYCDPDVFSVDRIRSAAQAAPPLRQDFSPRYILTEFASILQNRTMWPAFGLLLLCFPFLTNKGTLSGKKFLIVCLLSAATAVLLLLTMKLPARVYFPCVSLVTAMAILNVDRDRLFMASRWLRFASPLLIPVLSALVFCQIESVVKPSLQLRRIERRMLNCVDTLRKKNAIFVVFANAFPYEFISPSADLPAVYSGIPLVPFGGYNNSPWFQEYCRHLGFERTVLEDLDRQGVYLISNDYYNRYYVQFMKEHHNVDSRIDLVSEFSNVNMKLYRVINTGDSSEKQ